MSVASEWAQLPLTFDKLRKKHDQKKALRFRINHRTQQAIALQEHATTLEELKIADAVWQEIEELKRELKAANK